MGLKLRQSRRNPRRTRGLLLWIGLVFSIAPLGFNCHSPTDQSAAVFSQRADDEDQTVRAMASFANSVEADGAPVGDQKIRLTSEIVVSSQKASAMGLSGKLSSPDDSIIPKGTQLMALYDNECRGKKDAPVRFEAVDMTPAEDLSLAKLESEANQDPCLLRIDENQVRQFIAPISDTGADSFTKAAQEAEENVSSLATVNDAQVADARHITHSKALISWDWFYSDAAITIANLPTDVIVAVVDTGVLHTHPDLIDNRFQNAGGNNGFDFVNNDDNPTDDNGHGTHVAGIVGARANNAIGVTGVMGTRVKIMGVKVLDAAGSGAPANIVNGIRYAADQGAHVLNLSLGGQFTSTALRDAVAYAVSRGTVVVIAAGNSNALMDAGTNFFAPSGYAKDIPGSIAVGSVDAVSGARSGFSNFGPTYVWIGAPGSNGILSTYTGNTYTALQGTSMASPVVAGAAALLVAAHRARGIAYAPSDILNLLTDSARPVTALNTAFRGGATLDLERAAKLFFSRHVIAGNGATEAF
ncbi:MAG: S8 family serine peptidase [Deltaproteobacteria bacterium]|jgi:subtilisin family serine protease|nr:S8 family serine peptidase [Deltaproteobacteria bacterium]